jgi:hypothetical protein
MGTIWITPEGTYLTDRQIISSYYVDKMGEPRPAKFLADVGQREVEIIIAASNYFQNPLDVEVREGTKEEFDAWVITELAADRAKDKAKTDAKAAKAEQERQDALERDRIRKVASQDKVWAAAWKAANSKKFDASCKVHDAERAVNRENDADDSDADKLEKANLRLEKAQAAEVKAQAAVARLGEQAVKMAGGN